MADRSSSGSETNENSDNSSTDDIENPAEEEDNAISAYEEQRLQRIKENRARLEALGLKNLASTVLGSPKSQTREESKERRKGAKKSRDDDDEYRPVKEEQETSSSSSEDNVDEEETPGRDSIRKGKKKTLSSAEKSKKKSPIQRLIDESEFIDDDDALQQAIALSLGGPIKDSTVRLSGNYDDISRNKKGYNTQESVGSRKKRKTNQNISRVQMTEDELVAYFFSFDEAGKGNITVRDLRRVATAHDFIWTDSELLDMIECFDQDGDGKLSLEDFRGIVSRCHLLQGS